MISAAIICRDRPEQLRAAIGSLRGATDECVVLDTGSTPENFASLAAEQDGWLRVVPSAEFAHGDGKPFHFANARNEVARHCAHDWILVLDSDEELMEAESFADELAPILATAPDAASMNVYCVAPSGLMSHLTQPRIYNRLAVRYTGRVHTQPIGIDTMGAVSGTWIKSDYSNGIEEKAARSIPLLWHALEHDTDCDKLSMAYFLVKTYHAIGDRLAVLDVYRNHFRPYEADPYRYSNPVFVEAHCWAAIAAGAIEGIGECRKVLEHGLSIYPDAPHIQHMIACVSLVSLSVLSGIHEIRTKYQYAGLSVCELAGVVPEALEMLRSPFGMRR